jgi:hypothetical protein
MQEMLVICLDANAIQMRISIGIAFACSFDLLHFFFAEAWNSFFHPFSEWQNDFKPFSIQISAFWDVSSSFPLFFQSRLEKKDACGVPYHRKVKNANANAN